MKKTYLAITAAILMSASAFALDPPSWARQGNQTPQGQNPSVQCPNGGGQQMGQRNGKKTGPQDGSGPIHQPGTGGGNGGGRRGGRR